MVFHLTRTKNHFKKVSQVKNLNCFLFKLYFSCLEYDRYLNTVFCLLFLFPFSLNYFDEQFLQCISSYSHLYVSTVSHLSFFDNALAMTLFFSTYSTTRHFQATNIHLMAMLKEAVHVVSVHVFLLQLSKVKWLSIIQLSMYIV